MALTPRNWVILYSVIGIGLLVWSLVRGENMFKKDNWDKPSKVAENVHPEARREQEMAYSLARNKGLTAPQARAYAKAARSLWETEHEAECVGYSTIPTD
jgi:hypothetical protein